MSIHHNTVYPNEIKMDKVAHTIYRFGYTMQQSVRLSKEIQANLNNHARQYDLAQERYARMVRLANQTRQSPTQTPYWKAQNG